MEGAADKGQSYVLPDELDVVSRILNHVENKTTDLHNLVWKEPVEHYESAQRLERERVAFERLPLLVCPKGVLDKPGCFITQTMAGQDLLFVRTKEGPIVGFRNACRHRGARIAEEAGCEKAFVCRYHGWTYDLSGNLIHIPNQEIGFPGLKREEHGLVDVDVRELHGLIWVGLSPNTDWTTLSPLDKPLIALGLESRKRIKPWTRDVNANWKIVMETFLEGYHIRHLHKDSFYPLGYDNLVLNDYYGRHSRVIFPFNRIENLRELRPAERSARGNLTAVYQVFPSSLVALLTHHVNVLSFDSLSQTKTRISGYALYEEGIPLEKVDKDIGFLFQGLDEDFAAAESIQRAISSRANKDFSFGRFEGAITHFHSGIADALPSAT